MILAVDQGTSSTKAVLVDARGAIVARGAAAVKSAYPQPGWVEQDAEAIWQSMLDAVGRCLEQAPDAAPQALALTNQRESAVVWQRDTGAPAGPVIGWQDRRTADACERLREDEPLIRYRTGLALDPMFSATKLRWLLDRAPAGDLCAGTIDAYLIFRLTGGAVFSCEAGNASRTLLLNLREVAWDDELLALFGIPAALLPEVRRSDGGFGTSVMTPSGDPVEDSGGVSQTLAWLTDTPTWAFEGNIIASGAALDWMAATLGIPGGAALERLAREVDSPEGVQFVPAFSGLGAPYWDREARAVVDGMTLGTRPPHLARAAIEAVAHQVCDVLDAIDTPLTALHADGGASASDLVMQTQADLCGRPVIASTAAEMSALGVAQMAGLATGVWDAVSPPPSREFNPAIDADVRGQRRAAWSSAVARSRPAARVEALR